MEANFPRGGVAKKQSHETKNRTDEKDLFQTGEDDTKIEKGQKRKKRNEKKGTEKKNKKQKVFNPKSIQYNTGQIQQLSIKMLSTDMLVLGCVKEVHDYEVLLSLPGGLSGVVPITNISDAYHDQLKQLASQSGTEDDIEDSDIHSLHEIFKIGTILPSKIVNIGKNTKGKTAIKLTINPKAVNQEFEPSHIRDGLVLFGSIASQEDHGYVVDLGVKTVKAFLKNKDAERYIQLHNDGYPLMVGQSIICKVETGKDKLDMLSGESRTVTVTIDPNKLSSNEVRGEMDVPFRSLIPGMKVNATVDQVTDNGVTVKFLQYGGTIHRSHLSEKPNKALKNKQIKACVLYIHPTTKAAVLSNLPHLVEYKGVPVIGQFGQLTVCQIVENAEVTNAGTYNVLFKLPGDIKATCGIKNLSDGKIADVHSMFKHGSEHRCRVMDFHYIDQLVTVTLKQSILDQKYMSLQDIVPGDVIECTVETCVERGVGVKLSQNIHGFIPNLHLANSTFKTRDVKEFHEGKQLKCRVLNVDVKKRNVILTHKKMLLNTKLPILTDFDQLKYGMDVEGYIAKITNKGVLVAFFNGMKGWVPRKHLSTENIEFPEKVFFKGQVVKAKVLSWNEEKKTIILSFNVGAKSSFGTKEDESEDGMKIGQIMQCEVTGKTETGLDVKLPSSKQAFLPIKHLTDSMETSHLLLDMYNPGDVIENVMYLSRNNMPIMTARKSMIEYGKEQVAVTSINQIKIGMMIPGTIRNIMSYGVFVQFAGHLVGLSPNKFASGPKLEDLNTIYHQGQPVIAMVTEVDNEKNRCIVSLRMQDCYHGNVDIGIDLLSTYLREIDSAWNKVVEKKGKKNKLRSVKIGQVTEFIIEDCSEDGLLGHVTNGVKGICTKEHMDNDNYGEGSKLKCVVLFIDPKNKCVEVAVNKHIIKTVNSKQKSKHKVEVGQHVKGEITLIKKDCMMAVLKGKEAGTVVYLPSRRHMNDVLQVFKYNVGQVFPMIVKRIMDEHILCCFESHERQRNNSECELQVGDIAIVSVKDILDFQLNVLYNSVHGRIHLTEMVDSIENGTTVLSPGKYKLQQEVKARVVGFREWIPKKEQSSSKTLSLPEFTIKPSNMEKANLDSEHKFQKKDKVVGFVTKCEKDHVWLQVTPKIRGRIGLNDLSKDPKVLEDPTKHFKKGQGYNATVHNVMKDGALVLTLIENASESLTSGSLHKCVITLIKEDRGLFVHLPGGIRGVVELTEIYDKYTDDPTSDFYVGQYIDCSVIKPGKEDQHYLSYRKSRKVHTKKIVDPVQSSVEKGQILRGYVVQSTKTQLLVSLANQGTVSGTVTKSYVSDHGVDDVTAAFPVGKVVIVKVLSISPKVELSLRESDTGVKQPKSDKLKKKRRDYLNSEEEYTVQNNKKQKKSSEKRDKSELTKVKKLDRKRKLSELENANSSLTDFYKKSKGTGDSDSGIEDVYPGYPLQKNHRPCVQIKSGWCWDTEYKSPVITRSTQSDTEDDDEEENSQVESDQQKTPIQKDKKEEEKNLFQFEQHQLVGDITPEAADGFDRLALQSPNSSMVWLRYMAFHLETAEIEKARAVAERALKTISFREEQEKLNVWVAYLNLENMYGTPEELAKVLERALQQNEPLTVYQHLINIYFKAGKFQDAENTYNIMCRKFSYKKEPWIGFGLFHFKNGNFEAARKILPRCLKSLSKENHVETIAKFAQMEFKHGEPERGKTMFENILSNYPKRTDLWSVYVDMVIKTADIEAVRHLLDRVIHMKLSAKKMKFFFKKYLDFEQSHGDNKHVEYVKQKAFEYVESKGFVDE
ncbi:protein RRP5 homolog [Mytilus californianus]|uniref:protein RRP5 homolog n=1 Tax=Mytilus californianus TaxID=6549 RepID=UPI002245BFFA|nr:protein RRP5 homolog [Mytilus californianus]